MGAGVGGAALGGLGGYMIGSHTGGSHGSDEDGGKGMIEDGIAGNGGVANEPITNEAMGNGTISNSIIGNGTDGDETSAAVMGVEYDPMGLTIIMLAVAAWMFWGAFGRLFEEVMEFFTRKDRKGVAAKKKEEKMGDLEVGLVKGHLRKCYADSFWSYMEFSFFSC